MGRARRRTIAVLVLALWVAGCSDASDTAPPARTTATVATTELPSPVGGLVATIEVSRLFSLQRALALGLQNVGDEPVVVRYIQLETPLFETEPLTAREVLLQPGRRELVMPVPYGPPVCEGNPSVDSFTAVVVLEDDRQLKMGAPEKGAGGIGRLHGRECAAEGVHETVDLRFGDDWTADGRSVTGELVLEQRHPGTTADVDEVAGSVIFGVTVDREPPILHVRDGEPVDRVPIVVSADRCDPHALIESKKTFVFLSWVSVDGSEPVPVEVIPTGQARAALDQLLASCMS
jgi:hypothetical protein